MKLINKSKFILIGTYAFKTLIEAKCHLAFGSDWFVSPPAPIIQIWAAVNRLDHNN